MRFPKTRLVLAGLLIAALWLYVFPYSRSLNNPNERTRVMQAVSLGTRGALDIGRVSAANGEFWFHEPSGRRHTRLFVNDVALVCAEDGQEPPDCAGVIYPAKAPGAALLGAPFVSVGHALGFVKPGPRGESRATWLARLGITFPLLLGLLGFAYVCRRFGVSWEVLLGALIATGLGTTVFSYGVMFVGHALAGACLVGGLALLLRAGRGNPLAAHAWAFAGGLVTAWAVMLEYHAAVAVACVGVWVLATGARLRLLPGFAAGSGVVLALFLWLHHAMFKHPVRTGHHWLASAHNRASQEGGFLGIDGLHLHSAVDHLIDPYMGLVPMMPWLAVGGVVGGAAVWAARREDGGARWVVLAIPVVYLLFVSTLGQWRTMNGWSVGPRYLTPAMMPLAVLAALGWERLAPHGRAVLAGLAGASVLIVGAITVSTPSPPPSSFNTFAEVAVPTLAAGYGVRSFGLALGLGAWSLVPWFAGLLVAVAAVLWDASRRPWKARVVSVLVAVGVAFGWTYALSKLHPRPAKNQKLHRIEGQTPKGGGKLF